MSTQAGTTARMARGAAAGALATVAMSALMIASERAGIMRGQPPRLIVDRFLPGLGDRAADVTAVVAHVAYGAGAGAALLLATGTRAVPRSAGVAYGVLVWAGGYEGWVPAVGVLPPAHRDRPGRVLTMVAAHVVFGWTLAAVLRRI